MIYIKIPLKDAIFNIQTKIVDRDFHKQINRNSTQHDRNQLLLVRSLLSILEFIMYFSKYAGVIIKMIQRKCNGQNS